MGLLAKITGRVRGLFAGNYPENREDEQFAMNNRGDQCIAQSLPELTEVIRLGQSYQVKTATAFAALTTEPTTVAALSLWNGEPDNGMCYAVDSVALWERVVDTTQQNQLAVFAMLNKLPIVAPTDAALAIRSLSARSSYGGKARTVVGATVADDGWFPHGGSVAGAPAVAGGAWRVTDVPLRGLYLVPPKSQFSLHVAKIAATASQCQAVIRWHEVQLLWKS